MGRPANNSNRSNQKKRVARLFESIAVISLFYVLSLGWWVPVDMIIKLSPEKLLSPDIAELSFAASGMFYWYPPPDRVLCSFPPVADDFADSQANRYYLAIGVLSLYFSNMVY